MVAALTSQDVARLLSEPSPEQRADIADKVAASLSRPGLAPREIALAQDVVRRLAHDVAIQVRAALSLGLRHCRDLPRDVAMKLAADIEAVALPLLADSVVLTDDDLVEIVQQGSAAKHQTIAGRPNLAATVADALIVHAEAPAVAVLMANPTASINPDSLNHAVTRFADSEPVKQAMVLRHSLPITVAERLVSLVSKDLQDHLVRCHALPPAAAADIVQTSREHAIIRLSMGASEAGLQRMVTQMHHNGRLTPSLILRAVCTGDIAFFEAAMAVLADVPTPNAQVLIHEKSGRGLTALYRKARLPEALFGAIRAAVDVVGETGFDGDAREVERFRARVISRVLTLADTFDPSDADYLIRKLGDVLVHAPEAAA
jgi:uncharacterized protein (DUF2336 family)